MSKLYFNEYYQIAILINEKEKTYKLLKGKLNNIKATFTYKASGSYIKELFDKVKGVFVRV